MRARGISISLLLLTLCAYAPAQSADNLFQAAGGAFAEKLYRIAAENYADLVELFPDHPLADDADYLRAVAHFYDGDFRACLMILDGYARRYPGSENLESLHYWRGSSYYHLGDLEAGIRELSIQIDNYPAAGDFLGHALLLRGLALERSADPAAASVSFQTLLGLPAAGELHAEALFRLAGIHYRSGNFQQALVSASRLLLDFPACPQAPEALFLTAESCFYLGRDRGGEAEERYRRLLRDYPKSRHRETVLFQLSRLLERSGRGEEALAQVRELEAAFPRGRYSGEIARLKGDLFFDLKRYPEAWAAYEKAAGEESDPGMSLQIAYNLGLAYLRGGKPGEALAPLKRAAEGGGPESGAALFELGVAYNELNRSEAAAAALEQFLLRFHASPRREQALWLLGSVYQSGGAFDLAADTFGRLLTYYPDSPREEEYLFKRGSALLSVGDGPAALRSFFRLVDEYPGSRFSGESRYNIGYIYSGRGEYRRALPYFRAASDPGARNADSELLVRAELAVGSALFNLGEYSEALKVYSGLTSRGGGPYLEEAWFGAGRSYYKLERLAEAEQSFAAAFQAAAGRAETGIAETGIAETGIAETGIAEDADAAGAAESLYWQGVCAFRLGELERAAGLFLRLAADYPRADKAVEALFRAGSCAFQLEDYEAALVRFDRALLLMDGGSGGYLGEEILYQKGWSLVELGRRQEAENVFETLASEYPGGLLAPEAFFQLGEADFRAGETLAALALFERVLKDYPRSQAEAPSLYWAGKSAAAADRPGLALDYYLRYMERYPQGTMIDPLGEDVMAVLAEGDDPAAVEDFYLQVEENPGFSRTLKNRVRYEYARQLLDSEAGIPEKQDEARLLLQAIRRSDPIEPLKSEVNFLMGEIYQRRGELDRAADIFAGLAAVRADRLGAEAQLRVGEILEDRGTPEKAAEAYLKVYFLYPDYHDPVRTALTRAGDIYESLGQAEKAANLRAKLP